MTFLYSDVLFNTKPLYDNNELTLFHHLQLKNIFLTFHCNTNLLSFSLELHSIIQMYPELSLWSINSLRALYNLRHNYFLTLFKIHSNFCSIVFRAHYDLTPTSFTVLSKLVHPPFLSHFTPHTSDMMSYLLNVHAFTLFPFQLSTLPRMTM